MATNATPNVSIMPPSGDANLLTPPLTSANANSGLAASGEYKILRLKRKRNEEPLGGLLIEQALVAGKSPARGDLPIRKKKHLQGHGVFQLAETVDRHEAHWDDAQWRQDLQDRIVSKSQAGTLVSPTKERISSPPGSSMAVFEKSAISQRKFAILPKKRTSYILQSPRGTNITGIPLPGPSPLAQSGAVPENPTPDPRPESLPTVPPHAQQLQAPDGSISLSVPSLPIPSPAKDLPMFEAVEVSSSSDGEDEGGEDVAKKTKKGRESIEPVPVQEPQDEVPDEVAAFLPMLEEYLKLHDAPANILPSANPTTSKVVPAPKNSPRPASNKIAGEDSDGGEDYVWDVYYYTSQPITLSQWANMDNYGKVSILPCSDDSSDYGSHDDSTDDEGDEDSNAEEWYQNDYPEEETDPSDLSDGPEDSEEDAFYDGRDDEIADDIDYFGPQWEND